MALVIRIMLSSYKPLCLHHKEANERESMGKKESRMPTGKVVTNDDGMVAAGPTTGHGWSVTDGTSPTLLVWPKHVLQLKVHQKNNHE